MTDPTLYPMPNGAFAIVRGTDLLGYMEPGPRVLMMDEATVWVESHEPAEILRRDVPLTPSSVPAVLAYQIAGHLGDLSVLNVSAAKAVSLLGEHAGRFMFTAPARPVPAPDALVTHFAFLELWATDGTRIARVPVDTFQLRDFHTAANSPRGSETWRLLDAGAEPVSAAIYLSQQAAWSAARACFDLPSSPDLLSAVTVPVTTLESARV